MLTDIKNIRTKNTKRLYILTDNDIYNLTILALKGLSTNQQPKPNHIEQQQDQQQQQEQQQQQQQQQQQDIDCMDLAIKKKETRRHFIQSLASLNTNGWPSINLIYKLILSYPSTWSSVCHEGKR